MHRNMSWWCFLFLLLSLFQTCLLSSPSSRQLCVHEERSALLQLKQKHYHVPQNLHNYDPLNSWKPDTDCCFWERIACDGTTGHVVGLDLSNSSLHGSIRSNSSLFHLHHLQMLNLSWNGFDSFAPSGYDIHSQLTHLILSGTFLSGRIPSQLSQLTSLDSLDNIWSQFQMSSEMLRLSKLVFLDLYCKGVSPLKIPNLGGFGQKLSSLRELSLDGVNLSGQKNRDWCHHLSSALPNLHVLSMRSCSLTGPLDSSISRLGFLSELYLDFNSNLSSTVPISLMNLTSLTVLSLSYCGLHGYFPTHIFLQPNLKQVDLSENYLLSGHLPEFPQVNNSALEYLNVAQTKFQGKLPSSVGNLEFLKVLSLWGCNFSGPIPPSVANLTHLTLLDFSSNSFTGQIPSFFRGWFPNVEELWLGCNLLQGSIHSSIFSLPSMWVLDLSSNQFSGVINEPVHNISSSSSSSSSGPRQFYLDGNHLKGQDLMRSISQMEGTFQILDLSFNDFAYLGEEEGLSSNHSGDNFVNAQVYSLLMSSCNISKFPDSLKNQKKLRVLDLSYNRISKFPYFLRDLKTLSSLEISSNIVEGEIPKWIWQKNLMVVNMSNNLFTGLELPLPNHSINIQALDLHSNIIQECLSIAPCFPQAFTQSDNEFVSHILGNLTFLLSEASYFSISDNKLTGKIPYSICNASNLDILDLSHNQLSGTIPTCLGNSNLRVLNLESNKLHGSIPPTFKNGCNLHTLQLNKNMLEGEVPRSLGNCKELKVLDIADNQLNDTFPYWLENLSELQVLVMRSNNFGGPIAQLPQVDSPFPSLHVIDLSFNNFTGNLPFQYICQWKAMMFDEDPSELYYVTSFIYSETFYLDTLAIIEKGLYLKMQRILTTFDMVDLSNNNFKGKIPDALGTLKALKVLNLSGNCLTGQIPFSFGNLSELESLDLSRNKLVGEIPRQLTSLTFLAVLNLSYNNFTGSIPQGNQFDTFSNTSYEGNAELCGLPLSRRCGVTDGAVPPASAFQGKDDSTSLFDWTFALAGYCSGLIIGLVIGQQLFWRKSRCSKFISRVVVSKERKRSRKIKHHNKGEMNQSLNLK